jgi:4-amino-4-deoxy-L-arabinose transferase-like glycosyltransferase
MARRGELSCRGAVPRAAEKAKSYYYNPIFLLGLIAIFFIINNLVWLLIDTLPPAWDQSMHAFYSLKYLRLVQNPATLSMTKWLTVSPYWPPLFYIVSIPFTALLGFSTDSVAATNVLFLAIAIFGIYKIGTRLFNRPAGIGAVLISLLYPIVFALSRDVLLDFALLAAVVLVQYLILEFGDGFDLKKSAWLGVAVGCALLVKWTSAAFFIGTGLLTLGTSKRADKPPVRKVLISLVLLVLIAAAIAMPWYAKNYREFRMRADIALKIDASREGDPALFWKSLQWYWNALKDVLISKPLIPFTLVGLLAFFLWARRWKSLAFCLAWCFPALLIFILIPNKDPRFIVPLLPSIALLTSAGIVSIPGKTIRAIFWAALITIGVYQFYAVSFGWPRKIAHYYTHPPMRQDWKVEEILASIDGSSSGQSVRIAVLPSQPYFNQNIFKLQTFVKLRPYLIDGVGDAPLTFEFLKGYHILILKTGVISSKHIAAYRLEFLGRFWDRLKSNNREPQFIEWKRFSLPDGSIAIVYLIR